MHSYAKRMMLFSVNEFLIGGDDDDRGWIAAVGWCILSVILLDPILGLLGVATSRCKELCDRARERDSILIG